jgi:hypothetical protein
MGASELATYVEGTDPAGAFRAAVTAAATQDGHTGYTGTHPRKGNLHHHRAQPDALRRAEVLAEKLIRDLNSRTRTNGVTPKRSPLAGQPIANVAIPHRAEGYPNLRAAAQVAMAHRLAPGENHPRTMRRDQ